MADFTAVLNNFRGGKVSDKFKGRFDLELYSQSLEEFKNFFMGKLGGAYRRTGTEYVAEIGSVMANLTTDFTVIPFDSGSGNPYLVFLKNVAITPGYLNPPVYIYKINGSAPSLGSNVFFTGFGITMQGPWGGLPTWSKTTTFSTGSWVYQQVGDVIFLTHSSGGQKPVCITRAGENDFRVDFFDSYRGPLANSAQLFLGFRVPYLPANISTINMSITGTTLTVSTSYFTSDMIGSLIRLNAGSSEDVVVITAYTNTTTVTVAYLLGSTPTSATDDWTISAWNDEWGWPTSVTYHNQRIVWGGTPEKNYDKVWNSLEENLFHMAQNRLAQDAGSSTDVSGKNYFGDVQPTDPYDLTPASSYANGVTWLSGGRKLMIGTTGGENLLTKTADSIDLIENSNYGSSKGKVVKAGKDVIFIGKDGRSLRTYRYSEENGSWISDDLTSKADSIFLDGERGATPNVIKEISWNPTFKQLWVLMKDGEIRVMSYDPEYGLAGWTEVDLGFDTSVEVISVCQLPDENRTRFDTYISTRRYFSGISSSQTCLERITGEYINNTIKPYSNTNIIDAPRFLDFSKVSIASAGGVVDTFDTDLEGNTFDCFVYTADTFTVVRDVVVNSSGELDYTFPASAKVVYGYPYESLLKMLPMDSGGVLGSAISDIKDISRVYLKLYRSISFKIGSKDQRSGNDLSFETVTLSSDDLYSGEKEVFLFDNPDSEEQVIVKTDEPAPLNILAMIIKGDSKR